MQCLAYWSKIKEAERWGPEWSLQALAAAQRVQLSLSAFADNIYSLVQPHAESFKQVVAPSLHVCPCAFSPKEPNPLDSLNQAATVPYLCCICIPNSAAESSGVNPLILWQQ